MDRNCPSVKKKLNGFIDRKYMQKKNYPLEYTDEIIPSMIDVYYRMYSMYIYQNRKLI
jgi:hypothetical protein